MSCSNGSITLKSLAELAEHIDLESLPPGPADTDTTIQTSHDEHDEAFITSTTNKAMPSPDSTRDASGPEQLADVLARLAEVSANLEAAGRQDACAREQATIELARYETLAAEREEAQRALTEARRVRTTAELLATQAFTEQARVEAARALALSRHAELACTQLLAERTRAADELASQPHLAAVLAERRQREQERLQAAQRAEDERAERLSRGLAAARQALRDDRPEEARAILAPLARDFPSSDELQSVMDVVRWQSQQLLVGPAQAALREVRERAYRDDPERAVARVSAVSIEGLPDNLARQVFGVWSNACYHLVRQRGWHEPLRYSPATSRGVVLARRTPEGPYEVVSTLGMGPDWRVGDEVTATGVLRAARPLQAR